MLETHVLLDGIPAVFWGPDRPRRLIAVHGQGSHKEERTIRLLARRAVPLGWQVVSFDLPGHGGRPRLPSACSPQACVEDLRRMLERVDTREVALFAQGTGAQWSLMAYQDQPLSQALFLSPSVGPGLPLRRWDVPTSILSAPGAQDSPFGRVEDFAEKYHCRLTLAPPPEPLLPWLGEALGDSPRRQS